MRTRRNRWLGLPAVLSSGCYLASDGLELLSVGYSGLSMWVSLGAFVVMPYAMLALHSAMRDELQGWRRGASLFGAVLFGGAHIAYACTTMLAIYTRADDYGELARGLGAWYTVSGGVMILGGIVFAASVIAARSLPRWCAWMLVIGCVASAAIGLSPIDPNWQIAANMARGIAVGAMGLMLVLGFSSARH